MKGNVWIFNIIYNKSILYLIYFIFVMFLQAAAISDHYPIDISLAETQWV